MISRCSAGKVSNAIWCVIDVVAGLVAGFVVWILLAIPLFFLLLWGGFLAAAVLQLVGVVGYCLIRRGAVRGHPIAQRFLLALCAYPLFVVVLWTSSLIV